MHILLLSINYWPEQTGIGLFNAWRAEYLVSRGHLVTVCTGFPYYPEWKIPREYLGKLVMREEHNGVTILRSRQWVPKRVTTIRRVVFEASFLASSFLRALGSNKPDLLFVVSPPLGSGITANLLSRWWGVPYVFDVMDLQPDAAADLGMLPRPMLPVLYRMELLAYRHAALISTLTEGMRRRIISKGVAAEKVAIFPPRADEQLFKLGAAAEGQNFRFEHKLEGKFLVVHSGNMGVKQGLEVVLEAAALLRDKENFIFLVVGDGAMKSQLEERAEALRLDNLKFLPLQSERRFMEMLATTDVALVTQQRAVSDIAFPSKTVTLLSAGCPVLASVNSSSEVARVIEASGGVVVEPEDAASLAQTVDQLSRNTARLREMKSRARQYAIDQWSPERVLPFMETKLLKATWTQSSGRTQRSKHLASFREDRRLAATDFAAEPILPNADD